MDTMLGIEGRSHRISRGVLAIGGYRIQMNNANGLLCLVSLLESFTLYFKDQAPRLL